LHLDSAFTTATVTLNCGGSLPYLGALLDSDGSADNVYKQTTERLRQVSSMLLVKRWASAPARLFYLQLRTTAQEIYKIQFAPWNLHHYCNLDSILHAAYRHLTANMRSFPKALLELPVSLGGLGMPAISTLSQFAKWRMATRLLLTNDGPAVDSLLLHPFLHSHICPTIGFSYYIPLHLVSLHLPPGWATS